MPDWLIVIILGIVEGVTEFLPISSTGHLLLVQQWLGSQRSELFNVVIQSGTVLAVIAVFWTRVLSFLSQWREPATRDYLFKLAVAFMVTGVGGVGLKALHFKLPEKPGPVVAAVLIGGVLMLLVERWLRGRPLRAEITWAAAIVIGLAQLVAAMFPGTSRSGATILAALCFGLQRPIATEFTFLLGVPTLLAAGSLEILSAIKSGEARTENWFLLGLAAVIAIVTAFAAVKWLLKYVQTHTFELFGWYRICLGAVIIAWWMLAA